MNLTAKFSRRRTPSKPYDRPSKAASRSVRGGGQVAGERGGWLSRLLDPASKLIATGASKLFGYMLSSPPGILDKDLHSGADVSQHTFSNPLSETRTGETHNGGSRVDNQKNSLHNEGSSKDNQNNSSDRGIVELEQLLKHKTFTMVEENRLEELLRSRTVESSNGKYESINDKKRKSAGLASDDVLEGSKVYKKFPSTGLASQSQISMIASSPAEVAKAYMGSMPSKDSSLSRSLRDQVFNEKANSKSMASDPRCLDHSVAPRSVIRFFGISDQHQCQNHVYQTTKLVGRSAMYRMSRSPYFKVNRATSTKVDEISRDDHSSPVSSKWKSRSRQALKRGITALDDEYGSFGPIRRIRQKSNLMSPSRVNNSTTSMQKSMYLEGRIHGSTNSETAEDGTENFTMLPVQSSEKSHKLFQRLDKLLPSPKEKPSELKPMTIDESPSKLTLDMLRGSALKSMEDIRNSNFFSTQEVGKPVIASSQQNGVTAPSKSENMDEESKFPRNQTNYGVDLKAPQANGVSKTTLPSKNVTKPAPMTPKIPTSSTVSISTSKMPAFRISVPEDSFDMSDDEEEFAFPIASDTSTQSQLPPTPTMWTPLLNSTSNISSVSFAAATLSTTSPTPFIQQSEANTFKASSFSMPASTSQDTFGFGATPNNPQKPSAITFGADNNNSNKATNGYIFGNHSTQTATESAQASQSSACQFGLFLSSGSFGNSPFGSNPFTSSVFSASSQAFAPSSTSASAPVFRSSAPSSAPFQFWLSGSGFMLGSSASGSTSTSSSFTFNSSSSSTPAFGAQNPAFGFGANSPSAAASDFMFGSPAPTFSFGRAQNPMVLQPFQPGGGVDLNPGGSFSLMSEGSGDSLQGSEQLFNLLTRRLS